MARYGWNLNNIPKRPYTAPPKIACRICNHVFMSTQALIDHIETHMTDDDAQRSQQQQPAVVVPAATAAGGGLNLMSGQRNNNPFTIPSSSSSTALPFNLNSFGFPSFQERNPMFNPNAQNFPRRSAPQPYPPFMGMRNNFTVGSQQNHFLFHQTPRKAMEDQTTSDSTKPFLQQLDKPFPYKPTEKMRNKSDLDAMDLTLKL